MNKRDLDFRKIYEDFQPKILRYVARLVNETEAEDLTQEIFIKVNQALKNFRGESSLSTWLYRIATNAALDRLRSPSHQRIVQAMPLDASIDEDQAGCADEAVLVKEEKPPVEKQLIREEMNDCIRRYIEKLPETYRAVLVLSEYEGRKNSEIAEILGITLDTVKIRLHRAREKLKEELETNCEIHWIEEMPCNVRIPIK